jgi:hypothetical protein
LLARHFLDGIDLFIVAVEFPFEVDAIDRKNVPLRQSLLRDARSVGELGRGIITVDLDRDRISLETRD